MFENKKNDNFIIRVMTILVALSVCLLTACSAGASSDDHSASAADEGAGNDAGNDTGAAAEQQDPGVTQFDWYINYSWFNTPWGGNAVSKAITEKTGVTIDFVTPTGNEAEKLNALMASGTLPDLITIGWWEPQVNDMIQGDMVYALNKLADEYDAHFFEVADPQAVSWYTQPDGNLYGYPNSSITPDDVENNDKIGSNQTFLVRKDIYEAIGCPDMTTTEGFEAAVKKAKAKFPTVGGKPLIPVGAHIFDDTGNVSFDQYLQNFLAIPMEQDGKLYDRDTDPEYIKWLKMFRKLNEEGYLPADIFIDQRVQMEEKLAEGRYFCMLYQYTDMTAQQKTLYANDPDSIYIAVDGPRNSNGADYMLPSGTASGWTLTMISKNCKDPEKAIKFLDYLISEEGQKMVYLGVEGQMYEMKDGVPVIKEDVQKLLLTDRTKYDELYGGDDAYWMLQDNVMQLKWHSEDEDPATMPEKWTYGHTVYTGQYDVILPSDTQDAYVNDRINKLWSETLVRMLLAGSDEELDEILQQYKAKREALGFSELQKKKYEYVKQAKRKLGIE